MDAIQPRYDLFPPLTPYETGVLKVDDLHSIYWEEAGNPRGVPIVFLHGGPGAGAQAVHRRFFDPAHYRIILFDQRGCGRSRPLGEVRANTTADLVADMERLRRHLGVDQWVLFGGSWGSTLALAYGVVYPAACLGFILRGVFLGRPHEGDWLMTGTKAVFPEVWRAFAEFLPIVERKDLLGSYHRRLLDPDPDIHRPAAAAWCQYEAALSHLIPPTGGVDVATVGQAGAALARLEAHYIRNDCFLPKTDHPQGYLIENIAAIADKPAFIVQGRYDMVCPTATADELAAAWPGCRYTVVADAGHSALERGIRSALVAATEKMRDVLR